MKNLSYLFALLALATLANSASAQVISYSATTIGAATWNRPIAGTPPTTLSNTGTATNFHDQPFFVTVGGNYTFQSTATSPANWDNYTFLYSPTFNSATPLVNALTGNDDNPTIGLSGFTFALVANQQYHFITTGFANNDNGDFRVDISNLPGGSGGIFLGIVSVPEPSTIALIAGSSVGLLGWQYRRATRKNKNRFAKKK